MPVLFLGIARKELLSPGRNPSLVPLFTRRLPSVYFFFFSLPTARGKERESVSAGQNFSERDSIP